jgi:hypothetical protein
MHDITDEEQNGLHGLEQMRGYPAQKCIPRHCGLLSNTCILYLDMWVMIGK